MHYNQLAPGLPPSSQLGFGCGSIMGRSGKKHSLRILQQAFAAGITHFDAARSYGYGEAERCVGEALHAHRDQVVIASKFGILPPNINKFIYKLKPFYQYVLAQFPNWRTYFRKSAAILNATALPQQISLPLAKASLEKSLFELKTDYLDILFLHEGKLSDITEEMQHFLDSLVKEGKIRAYGAATSIEESLLIAEKYPHFLLQFPNSILNRNDEKLNFSQHSFITYHAFSNRDLIPTALSSRKDAPSIPKLMLSYALLANPKGTVVTSMLREEHLQKNIKIASSSCLTMAEINQWVKVITHSQ